MSLEKSSLACTCAAFPVLRDRITLQLAAVSFLQVAAKLLEILLPCLVNPIHPENRQTMETETAQAPNCLVPHLAVVPCTGDLPLHLGFCIGKGG